MIKGSRIWVIFQELLFFLLYAQETTFSIEFHNHENYPDPLEFADHFLIICSAFLMSNTSIFSKLWDFFVNKPCSLWSTGRAFYVGLCLASKVKSGCF